MSMKKCLLLLFCLVLCSCTHYEDGDYCDCGPTPPVYDTIELSSKELWFDAEGGIDSVTTKGEDWYMTTLVMGNYAVIGDTIIFLHSKRYYVKGGLEDMYAYESGTILINEENGYDVMSIETPWFAVDKPNNKKLKFSVAKNKTGYERKFSIHLVDYRSTYIDSIKVYQSAE